MDKYRYGGKSATIAAAAMLLSLAAIPAWAQAPGGSYRETCRHIQAYGGRVIADCRRVDGGWNRAELNGADSCAGGVANTNGQLTCNQARRDHRLEGSGSTRPYEPGRSDYNGR